MTIKQRTQRVAVYTNFKLFQNSAFYNNKRFSALLI